MQSSDWPWAHLTDIKNQNQKQAKPEGPLKPQNFAFRMGSEASD